LKNSLWRKRLIGLLIERKMLTRAACIQANTEKDVTDYRNYGLANPVAIIPNGVYAPDSSSVLNSHARFHNGSRKQAVYLGRIHPKKGLANLIHAWGANLEKMRCADWQLIIAGKDEASHLAELKSICRDYGIMIGTEGERANADVILMGPTYGQAKFELLTASHLFMLPSFSEGLPMAVLEAWAHGTPAMISPACNLGIGFDCGAALSVDPTIESISRGLLTAVDMSNADFETMGLSGRTLVDNQFVWSKVAKQMHELYRWLVGGGDRPAFVTQ
jgi:glycosyltransferase involved in cell wall biosynthesis